MWNASGSPLFLNHAQLCFKRLTRYVFLFFSARLEEEAKVLPRPADGGAGGVCRQDDRPAQEEEKEMSVSRFPFPMCRDPGSHYALCI